MHGGDGDQFDYLNVLGSTVLGSARRATAHYSKERSLVCPHYGESKLSGMKEGMPITIELNEAGNAIEIRKAG